MCRAHMCRAHMLRLCCRATAWWRWRTSRLPTCPQAMSAKHRSSRARPQQQLHQRDWPGASSKRAMLRRLLLRGVPLRLQGSPAHSRSASSRIQRRVSLPRRMVWARHQGEVGELQRPPTLRHQPRWLQQRPAVALRLQQQAMCLPRQRARVPCLLHSLRHAQRHPNAARRL